MGMTFLGLGPSDHDEVLARIARLSVAKAKYGNIPCEVLDQVLPEHVHTLPAHHKGTNHKKKPCPNCGAPRGIRCYACNPLTSNYCSKCKIKKPISEFYSCKLSLGGYISICRLCCRAINATRYLRIKAGQ